MVNFTSEELFIGKIKTLTTDSDTKALFDTYVPTEPFETNVKLLGASGSIKLPHLKSAAQLLCSLSKDFPAPALYLSTSKSTVKEAIAIDIVTFIHRCREGKCLKCSDDYSPFHSANAGSNISCFFCHQPAHLGCYNDAVLDTEAGVVFVCPSCLGSPIPPEHFPPPPTPTVDVSSSNTSIEVKDAKTDPSASDANTPRPQQQPLTKKNYYDRSKEVCPLLLKNECPHGISVKQCQSYHPPWCSSYQSNSPGGKRGCNKDKSKCRYFHPKLCQNALATGVCVSKVCKEVHIKGTITSEETLKKSKNSQKKPAHNNSKLTHQQQQAGRDSQSRKPSTPSSRNSNPRAECA